MEGYYFDSSKEAVAEILSRIPDGSSVSWGGFRHAGGNRNAGRTPVFRFYLHRPRDCFNSGRKEELQRKAFCVDYYFMSTNAITLDGKLVNIDGNGNRAAALICGPDHVIILAGMNKVAADTDAAVKRYTRMPHRQMQCG